MRTLCFYLPQYHPDPDNDRWWGKGFTDWRNVARARPRFAGHHQPRIPADLGFYDLRLADSRQAQADLARAYGITGFCYYHYWFQGRRPLRAPLDAVLSSGEPDFPFCLCWANENWTRAWDGLDHELLLRQQYSEADDTAHREWLAGVFADRRYLRIDGRPLFLVYRPDRIPNLAQWIERWRRQLQAKGLPDLYLCAVNSGLVTMTDPELIAQGCDATVDFQPNREDFPPPQGLRSRLYGRLQTWLPDRIYQALKLRVAANKRIDYRTMAGKLAARDWPDQYRRFPCVFPSWDNSPRRASATIIQNTDPATYRQWLAAAVRQVRSYPQEEQLVFINAWNEWAEGCHLEPDLRSGHAFLDATRAALDDTANREVSAPEPKKGKI